jgi:hypothetical protein
MHPLAGAFPFVTDTQLSHGFPMTPTRLWLLASLLTGLSPIVHAQTPPAGPASIPVPGWKAPAPGEHPRLLFRKSDIPALRQRAQTPAGKAQIANLKTLLGGGDAMPANFSSDKVVNSVDENAVGQHPVGTFTLSHPVGFGMLYVLTGDKRYAELSRQCVDKIFEGQVDRDSRYNWPTPGTGFRLGFVLQSLCLSYDLCADAWPADYRKQMVERILAMKAKKVDKDKFYDLEGLAKADGYPPGSNHYGPYLLGPGLVALTFKGEPGADDKRLDALLATVEENLGKLFGQGFGDHGWYPEGTACGRIATNCGVAPLLQSLKVAGGKDYLSPRPDARFAVLRLMSEIVPQGGKALTHSRGDYGDENLYKRPIISHMGDFAQGMGAVLPREAQAMAWIYDTMVEPGPKKTWNAGVYPHLAVYAFVNWPDKSMDPDEVLPRAFADDKHGYYLSRNRWENGDDVLVTSLLKRGPGGYKSGAVRSGTIVWGFGERFNFGGLTGKTSHYRASADGSMELADDKGNALVVDYSGASGAPALVAMLGEAKAGGKKAALTVLPVGAAKVSVLTFSDGAQPTPTATEKGVTIGKQVIKLENGHLSLGTFTPAPAN